MFTFSRFPRYKVICSETWPTPSCSMRDATTLICTEHDLVGDIAYGKTKVFIRSPQTLTALEQERVAMLPQVAIIIQKVRCGQ